MLLRDIMYNFEMKIKISDKILKFLFEKFFNCNILKSNYSIKIFLKESIYIYTFYVYDEKFGTSISL